MKISERERAIQIHFFPQHEVLLSLDFNYVTKQKKTTKKEVSRPIQNTGEKFMRLFIPALFVIGKHERLRVGNRDTATPSENAVVSPVLSEEFCITLNYCCYNTLG